MRLEQQVLVEAIVDTLGTRFLEIAVRGRVHIRLTFDSTSWIDVRVGHVSLGTGTAAHVAWEGRHSLEKPSRR